MESPAPQDTPHPLALAPSASNGWPRRSGRIRVTRACDRCKKRKVRCSGQHPCHVCIEAAATCSYEASYSRGRRPAVRFSRVAAPAPLAPESTPSRDPRIDPDAESVQQPSGSVAQQRDSMPRAESVSRASPEPSQTDLEGHYVGPSSGISFLSRVQKRLEQSVFSPRSLSVFNFGDAPLPYGDAYSNPPSMPSAYPDPTFGLLLDRDDTARLVRRYFDFAVPVDRFLHRPTVEKWFEEFYETRGRMLSHDAAPAQTAVLFMVFAIAQEHTTPRLSPPESDISGRYFRAATHQLSSEQGPVRLASVQARLCQCLWLLSQSRINHCWSLFGTVARLAFALGLHRNRHPRSHAMSQVEIECRRRTFWSAYSLDNYLSSALGRPRTFHDKDIDQELPSCADDGEIHDTLDEPVSSSGPGLSPMFGPVSYAKLSRILSGILSDIYSIQPMSMAERFALPARYMKELQAWRSNISGFLDQNTLNAAPLVLIYQRQRNVLNLAYWHTVILTNRPLLLTSFSRLTNTTPGLPELARRAQTDESIAACLQGAMEIVGIVDTMIQAKQLFRAFWFTAYFAFSACVILYVYTIQHSQEPDTVYRAYFAAADRCQQQILDLAEEGSLTARYCLVLEELRAEAVRQMGTVGGSADPSTLPTSTLDEGSANIGTLDPNVDDLAAGFGLTVPELVGMGQLDYSHASPTASLEDRTGWGQFDSMAVSGFNSFYNLGSR